MSIATVHITDPLRLKGLERAMDNRQIVAVIGNDGKPIYGIVLSIYNHMGSDGHNQPCWNVHVDVTGAAGPMDRF